VATNKLPLDERCHDVLRIAVQLYVTTGMPVPSEAVCHRLQRPVSSATVRAIMGRLERAGYLDQPHTSAGRVPTPAGLRLYVDVLMQLRAVSPSDERAIEAALTAHKATPADVLETACHILSQLTGNVGFAIMPDAGRLRIRHIDFVRLPLGRILVVLVSRAGVLTHRVLDVSDDVSQIQLQTFANEINARFSGMSLRDIRGRLLDELRADKALYDSLLTSLIAATEAAFTREIAGDPEVYLDGTATMLAQHALADRNALHAIFLAFEEKQRLLRIISACIGEGGVRVQIGCEGLDPSLSELSLITAGYGLDGEPGWGVGVLGPTRMEYPRIVSLVEATAARTHLLLTELNAS